MFARSIICYLVSIHNEGSRMSWGDSNSAFGRSLAATMMIWSLVAVGIRRLCGNYFPILHMRVDVVSGDKIYTNLS